MDYKMQKTCFLCGARTAFKIAPHAKVTREPALLIWICENSLLQQSWKENIEQL
jgi:hypothetical protein